MGPRLFQGVLFHQWARIATNNLPTKFEISISTHYEDMKGDAKWGRYGSLEIAPFDESTCEFSSC